MVIQEVNVDYQYALTGANGKTIYIDSAKAPIFQTNDPSQRFSDRYWEMWAVINGDFFAGGISGPFVTKVNGSTVNLPGIQTLQTDTFSTPTNLSIGGTTLVKTCGWFSQTGTLMWVSKTKQQMQDPATYAGWEINSKSPAGPLYFSSTQPVAWKANVVNPNAVFATRSWFFQWCWDKNNPKGNYDAQIPLPKAANRGRHRGRRIGTVHGVTTVLYSLGHDRGRCLMGRACQRLLGRATWR